MKWFSHLKTITHHKCLVMKYCFKLGLYRQGLMHDMSKYSFVEFRAGAKYYQGNRSPNEIERLEKGYSAAWLHHKGRNRHHIEYWIDYSPKSGYMLGGMEMPVKYVAEMFCDRIAACRTYRAERYTDRDAYDYYMNSRAQYLLHDNTRALLETMLIMLKDEGEDTTFDYIKHLILKK
ncbi:MAG: DUF5662 family protein [Oscillospiraceae bacterium]